MAFFLRYTETPAADLERGVSYHLADVETLGYEWKDHFNAYAQELPGICAFKLNAETIEDAIQEAAGFKFNSNFFSPGGFDSYCIMTGKYIDDCPEGVIILPGKIVHIEKRSYFEE